jgi:hypothetical protein
VLREKEGRYIGEKKRDRKKGHSEVREGGERRTTKDGK